MSSATFANVLQRFREEFVCSLNVRPFGLSEAVEDCPLTLEGLKKRKAYFDDKFGKGSAFEDLKVLQQSVVLAAYEGSAFPTWKGIYEDPELDLNPVQEAAVKAVIDIKTGREPSFAAIPALRTEIAAEQRAMDSLDIFAQRAGRDLARAELALQKMKAEHAELALRSYDLHLKSGRRVTELRARIQEHEVVKDAYNELVEKMQAPAVAPTEPTDKI